MCKLGGVRKNYMGSSMQLHTPMLFFGGGPYAPLPVATDNFYSEVVFHACGVDKLKAGDPLDEY